MHEGIILTHILDFQARDLSIARVKEQLQTANLDNFAASFLVLESVFASIGGVKSMPLGYKWFNKVQKEFEEAAVILLKRTTEDIKQLTGANSSEEHVKNVLARLV